MHFDLLARLMHIVWRFSRGQKVEVHVVALDDSERVFLARREAGWELPNAMLLRGQSAPNAAAHALVAHGIEPTGAAPALSGLHRAAGSADINHVALYLVRNVSFLPDAPASTGGFFPADALPDGTPDATRHLIADALRTYV